jgi:hypothetical protein
MVNARSKAYGLQDLDALPPAMMTNVQLSGQGSNLLKSDHRPLTSTALLPPRVPMLILF